MACLSGGCGLGCLAAADVGGGDFGFWRLRRILGCLAAADAGCGDLGVWRGYFGGLGVWRLTAAAAASESWVPGGAAAEET